MRRRKKKGNTMKEINKRKIGKKIIVEKRTTKWGKIGKRGKLRWRESRKGRRGRRRKALVAAGTFIELMLFFLMLLR